MKYLVCISFIYNSFIFVTILFFVVRPFRRRFFSFAWHERDGPMNYYLFMEMKEKCIVRCKFFSTDFTNYWRWLLAKICEYLNRLIDEMNFAPICNFLHSIIINLCVLIYASINVRKKNLRLGLTCGNGVRFFWPHSCVYRYVIICYLRCNL